jgi:glucokinase
MSQPTVVLGLDYGGTKIAVAAYDLAGHRLASATMDSGSERGAQASFDRGIAVGRDLLAAAAPGSSLAAVGVSTFGIPFEDRVELAPAISGWDRLAMGRELRAAFPAAQIRMATDAKAAAWAETRWGVLADCDPGIFVNLGTGLAAALVVGGQVLNGRDGAAGEIGYSLREVADAGRPLRQRIPLEDMVSGQAMARRGTERATAGQQLSTADVFAAGRGGGELAGLVDEFVDELAFHLVNLAICLNPARIAVGGGLVRSWDRIRPGLERALSNGVPFPPELVVARFPYDAPLRGAVAMAVDAANAPARAGANTTAQAGADATGLAADDSLAADGGPVTISHGGPA